MTVRRSTALTNGVANRVLRDVSTSRRNSWRGDLTLKVVVAIALTSFSCASVAQPDEKPTNTFQVENKERRRVLLQKIQGLIDEPPINATKISTIFGWPVAREIEGPNGAYTHTFFRFHPQDPGTYPLLTVGKNDIRLSIQLISGLDPCVSGDDVLAQFGTDFKSSLSILHPHPDPSTFSDEVKSNTRKFFHGPTYYFPNGPVSTSINFSFPLTACLTTIHITQTAETKATQ